MNIIRTFILKILKLTQFNTNINHHLTNSKFYINTFKHKGYWYYGKKREENTIEIFKKWIKNGDFVLEIGAHIGYFSTFYANLVGENGKVVVFEPSEENLKYLRENINNLPQNLKSIVTIIPKGAGDINETLNFYIDPLTGQNNSFVEDFEGFYENRKHSGDQMAELEVAKVEVITLDSYFSDAKQFPNFVKIDVEGFEWNVVNGFKETIKNHHPKLMIEIQKDAEPIINFFLENGYTIYNDQLIEIKSFQDYQLNYTPNIFFSFN